MAKRVLSRCSSYTFTRKRNEDELGGSSIPTGQGESDPLDRCVAYDDVDVLGADREAEANEVRAVVVRALIV